MAIICSKCVHENIGGTRLCDVCKSELPTKCPKCSHINSATNEFCDVCGTILEDDCPICFSSNLYKSSFCTSCGYTLNERGIKKLISKNKRYQPRMVGKRLITSPVHKLPTSLKQDRYILSSIIKEDNFNIVCKAFSFLTLNVVIIKKLFPNPTSKIEIEEFLFAAKEWSECLHPNLVKVLDWFEENETAYVVMEFIDGETLASILEREKKLFESRVKLYLLQISNALSVVHAKGILHRDINPSSIILNPDGKPVIIDFDNARQSTGKEQKMSNWVSSNYMPIEQGCSIGEFTPSPDIYSLCALAYQLLTGALPNMASNRDMERIKSNSNLLILPSKLASLSSSMEAILLKGLGIIPNERFQSMQ